MAVAKYKKGKDGRWEARVWDGTYTPDGQKRRKHIYSTKSSKDLEEKVIAFQQNVKARKNVQPTDDSLSEYARRWIRLYKSSAEIQTQKMYLSLVDRHMDILQYVRVPDLQKVHILEALAACQDRPRTQEQLLMMLKQVVKAAISENLDRTLNLQEIAARLKVSREHLSRIFRERTGITPREFAAEERMQYAVRLLRDSFLNCEEIAERAGYSGAVSFSRAFRKRFGYSPAQYRKQRILQKETDSGLQ